LTAVCKRDIYLRQKWKNISRFLIDT